MMNDNSLELRERKHNTVNELKRGGKMKEEEKQKKDRERREVKRIRKTGAPSSVLCWGIF